MMVFYKMQGNSFNFQLRNLEEKEGYSVWNNQIRAFLREGGGKVIVGTDNTEYKIGETKYIKSDNFVKLFPNCSKKTQIIREINLLTDGKAEPYVFGFTIGANDKIRGCVDTLQKAKQNPLDFYFTLRRNGTGLDTTYEVIAGDYIGQQQQQQQAIQNTQVNAAQQVAQQKQSQEPPIKSGSAFSIPTMQNYIVLAKEEDEILDEAELYPAKLSEEEFVSGFCHTMLKQKGITCAASRAKEIYLQHYVKVK